MATKSRGMKKVVPSKKRLTLSIVMPKGVTKELAELIEDGFKMTVIHFWAPAKGKGMERAGYLNFLGRQGKWKVVRK